MTGCSASVVDAVGSCSRSWWAVVEGEERATDRSGPQQQFDPQPPAQQQADGFEADRKLAEAPIATVAGLASAAEATAKATQRANQRPWSLRRQCGVDRLGIIVRNNHKSICRNKAQRLFLLYNDPSDGSSHAQSAIGVQRP